MFLLVPVLLHSDYRDHIPPQNMPTGSTEGNHPGQAYPNQSQSGEQAPWEGPQS